MINYTFKKGFEPKQRFDIANFYQRSFATAVLNWEINRQEERLQFPKSKTKS
jgi:hypothetical protein